MKYLNKIAIALFLVLSFNAKAQLDLGLLLESGSEDANTYLENYMAPMFRGLGFGLNGGWYNTAKTHKKFGFDLSITMMASKVPEADEFFTFNNSDFKNLYYADGSSVRVPTMFGPNLGADDLPQLSVRDFDDTDGDGDITDELIRISAPTGLGLDESDIGEFLPFNSVPVPMIQLGVGLIKNTDLKVRYIPKQDFDGDATLELFGVGIMHDITQWLPAEKLLPLDLSLALGYTSMKSEIFLDKDANQSMALEANSFLAQVIASKEILTFTPYVGLGYATANSNVALKGRYETESSTLVDPIQFDYQNNGFRANVGLRIRFAVITFTGEYAFQEYETLSVGMGVTIR